MEKYPGKGRAGREISRRDFLKGTAMVVGGAAVTGLAMFLSACGPEDVASPGANEIWITARGFVPKEITVPIDTTVTWTNRDRRAHTVTGNTPPIDKLFESGQSFSYTFREHLVLPYHCSKHPKMTGRVSVEQRKGADCVTCHDVAEGGG